MIAPSPLAVPEFPFDSPLASKAMALERLRGDLPRTASYLPVITELGELYQLMSSIISARIEGNHTTIADAVEGARQYASRPGVELSDSVQEIVRLQEATEFLDSALTVGTPLSHALVRELHHVALAGLEREGDRTPGAYRNSEVAISGSRHRPPPASAVHAQMTDLIDFANEAAAPQFQLIRMALAHHRFVWIHPFTNGNGRVARLFSYAMIRSYGFAPDVEYQTVNPTTVFGADRPLYYARLAAADSLEPEAMVDWADFVLGGLLRDMEAMHQLTQPGNLNALIWNAIDRARGAALISEVDAAALSAVADGNPFKAGDLAPAVGLDPSGRSRLIHSLRDRQLVRRLQEGGRIYRIRLSPNALTAPLFAELDELGLLPSIISGESTLR